MKEVKNTRKPLIFYYAIAMVVLMLLNALVFPRVLTSRVTEVDYGEFLKMAEDQNISKVQVTDTEIVFADKATPTGYYKTGKMEDVFLVDRLKDAGIVSFGTPIVEQVSPILSFLLTWVLPIVVMVVVGQLMMRYVMKKMGGNMGSGIGGAMSFGKSNAKVYVPSEEGIRFSDVAGEDEAKELLTEIVDYLHNPGKYAEIGAAIPKGALLVGPPGTGKTILAKAVAGEAHVPFFSIAGSEFVEMFVGMGAAKVRDLFKQANEKAPCIVFIDEIDTIGKKRDGVGISGNDEREQTLNQLLTEMDGFDGKKGVVILAATNRPESLDPALLRPGRFDRRIPVELPDLKGREAILKVHGKKVKVDESVDYNEIARATNGASGAELANIVNEAALRAVRMGRKTVSQQDLEESVETVIAGYQKKDAGVSGDEKKIVSYHEIGHALVAALQTHSAPVTQDHDYAANLRGTRIYDAGGGGSALPDEQRRGVQQDRDTDRRPCGGGADLPLHHDRSF